MQLSPSQIFLKFPDAYQYICFLESCHAPFKILAKLIQKFSAFPGQTQGSVKLRNYLLRKNIKELKAVSTVSHLFKEQVTGWEEAIPGPTPGVSILSRSWPPRYQLAPPRSLVPAALLASGLHEANHGLF